jgi:hypothetical protein
VEGQRQNVKNCTQLVKTRTAVYCTLLIGLLASLFTVSAIKDSHIDKYVPSKAGDSFKAKLKVNFTL